MSIIVLTLTITPCCSMGGTESYEHETVHKDKHECGEQDDDCCKDCSPFYVCGTCIGFTFNTQRPINFTVVVRPVKHDTAYILTELPLNPLSIWQPPKLS